MIHNKVSQFREGRGVTKAHLARRVRVSRSYVTKLEQGRLQPSIEVALRIAGYLETSVEELFQSAEEPAR